MALIEKLRVFLEQSYAGYAHTIHPQAYTARELASAEHLPNREVAKSVIVFGDNRFHMIVIPANRLVDFQEVRLTLGLAHARLATETEIAGLFPDCELGAMPAMGNLYGMPVYLDSALAEQKMIAFNAGTHRDVVHMHTDEYVALVHPIVVSLAREAAMRHGWWRIKAPAKTNAARLLDQAGVSYQLRDYPVGDEHLNAAQVAEAIGMPPEQVFKTLVARGDRNGVVLACIPANTELDLKALAAASGNKKVELVAMKEVLGLTGYVRGGVSPVGTRKPYPLYLDETSGLWDVISVSAGIRGCQMLLNPADLARVAGAVSCPIAIF